MQNKQNCRKDCCSRVFEKWQGSLLDRNSPGPLGAGQLKDLAASLRGSAASPLSLYKKKKMLASQTSLCSAFCLPSKSRMSFNMRMTTLVEIMAQKMKNQKKGINSALKTGRLFFFLMENVGGSKQTVQCNL